MERTARFRWPDLTEVLGSVPWAVAGAVATRLYMPERATADLDIVIRAADAADARRRFSQAGYAYTGELGIGGSAWMSPDGTRVEALERSDGWIEEALAQAAANRDPQGLPVLPLAYLVLMKLQASRAQDVGDLARMLGQADEEALAAVRDLITREAPGDLEDLESLIQLGRLEIEEPS